MIVEKKSMEFLLPIYSDKNVKLTPASNLLNLRLSFKLVRAHLRLISPQEQLLRYLNNISFPIPNKIKIVYKDLCLFISLELERKSIIYATSSSNYNNLSFLQFIE